MHRNVVKRVIFQRDEHVVRHVTQTITEKYEKTGATAEEQPQSSPWRLSDMKDMATKLRIALDFYEMLYSIYRQYICFVSGAVASWSKASCLRLALRNARWFGSSWEKKFSHEISASVWDRCPSSIVMHLGGYDSFRQICCLYFRKAAQGCHTYDYTRMHTTTLINCTRLLIHIHNSSSFHTLRLLPAHDVKFKVCHGSLYAVMWLAYEPKNSIFLHFCRGVLPMCQRSCLAITAFIQKSTYRYVRTAIMAKNPGVAPKIYRDWECAAEKDSGRQNTSVEDIERVRGAFVPEGIVPQCQ
ncbi:hypothetical protein ANN_10774 [Periplaneta americana]|uniref:Uncharacterized protein n=1 Tax=Periplaneta americana TaxID=6978 RepID=A0ABQ8T4K5_PERAM|nr:hypothetical protein ANN_10774 [Periplaneta americana]